MKGKRAEDTDLTVALPQERARPTLARGSQLGTEPPTMSRGLPNSGDVRLGSDSDSLGVDPTHVGADLYLNTTPITTSAESLVTKSDDPYIGRVMSERYRIIKKIGEGGMGTVYLAEHIVIEKKVAIKILSDDLARKGDLVTRFMQEAKAASRIGHENIVDITDFGQTDAGSVFFAMEYLEGSDLATIIRDEGPLPFARVRHIVTQICRALGAAHGKGIIHRDMKPENIFIIERDGRADFVKILDFGIAKMSSMDESNERLTRTGMIFGTPEYMSPEQARGERPDHRVDIYAVGCILYEMLTGDVPFHAETFMGVLTKHMFEPPEAPHVRAPAAQIPADVEAVVMKGLAKNRDERYLSMRDFSLAIAACDGGDTTAAWGQEGSGQYRPLARDANLPSGSTRARQRPAPASAPRGRAALWLGIIGGAALAAGVILWTRSQPLPIEQPPVTKPIVMVPTAPAVKPVEPPPAIVRHKFTVKSDPWPADVFHGDEKLCATTSKGCSFVLDHSSAKVTLRVSKRLYADYKLEVTPDRDGYGELQPHLQLIPVRRPVGSPGVRKTNAADTAPRVNPPRVEQGKTDPPPKPGVEQPKKRPARDLMNPFPEPGASSGQ